MLALFVWPFVLCRGAINNGSKNSALFIDSSSLLIHMHTTVGQSKSRATHGSLSAALVITRQFVPFISADFIFLIFPADLTPDPGVTGQICMAHLVAFSFRLFFVLRLKTYSQVEIQRKKMKEKKNKARSRVICVTKQSFELIFFDASMCNQHKQHTRVYLLWLRRLVDEYHKDQFAQLLLTARYFSPPTI